MDLDVGSDFENADSPPTAKKAPAKKAPSKKAPAKAKAPAKKAAARGKKNAVSTQYHGTQPLLTCP